MTPTSLGRIVMNIAECSTLHRINLSHFVATRNINIHYDVNKVFYVNISDFKSSALFYHIHKMCKS